MSNIERHGFAFGLYCRIGYDMIGKDRIGKERKSLFSQGMRVIHSLNNHGYKIDVVCCVGRVEIQIEI